MNHIYVHTCTFVYMPLELGGGGGLYKNNVLMWLMCLMFAVKLCELYVMSYVCEIKKQNMQPCHICVHGFHFNGCDHQSPCNYRMGGQNEESIGEGYSV